MERINLYSGLTSFNQQHATLKETFNKFQNNLLIIKNNDFPAEDIIVHQVSDTITEISFIDRTYELQFSSDIGADRLNGLVKFVRTFEDDIEPKELNTIVYEFNGIAIIDDQGQDKNFTLDNKDTAVDKILELLIFEINKRNIKK